jgi:hypothetical protein
MSGADHTGNCFPRELVDISSLSCGSDQKGGRRSDPPSLVKSRPFAGLCADHIGPPAGGAGPAVCRALAEDATGDLQREGRPLGGADPLGARDLPLARDRYVSRPCGRGHLLFQGPTSGHFLGLTALIP